MRLAAVFCLVLTACVAGDPYSQIAAGEAALKATQAQRGVSAEQTRGALDVFAIEQTRQAGEELAIQAQAKGTQEAIAYQQTAIALNSTTTSAVATNGAVMMQTTIDAGLRNSHYYATQTAIPLASMRQVDSARRANVLRWVGVLFTAGLGAVVLLALVVFVDVVRRRSLAAAAWQIYRSSQAALDLPAIPPQTSARKEMTDFLYQAATVAGSSSQVLPRHDKLNMSADKWTRFTGLLVSMGALIKVGGRGSFIRQPYRTVGGLYQAVASGKLAIPPSPTVDMRQYWAQNVEQNGEQDD